MKAYKCILPFMVLFLVHDASATFGLWNSEKIKSLIKHKINRLYIPFITPKYTLLNHDYPIFRYYFLKPASAKNIFINDPVNVQHITDGVVYSSSAGNIQTSDLSYVNMLEQHGSTYEFSNVNNDNLQAFDQSNGAGVTGEYENKFIFPADYNNNIQVDGVSNNGIVKEYVSDYVDPHDNNDNVQYDGYEYENYNPQTDNQSNYEAELEGNIDTSVNPESPIEFGENIGETVTESNTDSDNDGTHVIDADESIIIIGEDNISGADTEPIIEDADESIVIDKDNISEAGNEPITEDVDESGFADAEPYSKVNGDESDYLNTQSDLVYDETIDKYGKLKYVNSDTESAKGYDTSSTDAETITGNAINNPINSNIDYFPLIDVRIGGTNVDDY